MNRPKPQIRRGFADFDGLRRDAASKSHDFFVECGGEEEDLERQLHCREKRDHGANVRREVTILEHMIGLIDDQTFQIAPVVSHGLHCVLHRVRAADYDLGGGIEGDAFERASALDGRLADELAAHLGDLQGELARVDQNEDLGKLYVLIDIGNGAKEETDRLSTAVLSLDDNVMTRPRGNRENRTHWLKI